MTLYRRSFLQAVAALSLVPVAPIRASAQSSKYPVRLVKIIVPFAAGTAADVAARALADHFGSNLGGTVIVENRPGAEGMIGLKALVDAPADGHTIGFAPGGLMTLSGLIFPMPGLKPESDVIPVRRISRVLTVLVVSPKLQAANLRQLIDLSKKSPKPLTYWTGGGLGERVNLMSTVLFSKAGANVNYVNYRAPGEALANIANGDLDFAVVAYAAARPFIEAQRIRAIGAFENQRSTLAPDQLSLPESGFPGEWRESWSGVFVKAGTPVEITNRIGQSVDDFLKTPQGQTRLRSMGMEPVASTQGEAVAWAAAEHADFVRIVNQYKIGAKQ